MDTTSVIINDDIENFAPEYRDRLRTWLVKMINSGTIPGLLWENEERTIFRMPWKHAGRQDYILEEDSKIFMEWAKHSGRYREGIDKPEPIVWKTRLRCALNKMPDIKELSDRSRLDISEPYRVYQLLPPIHKASQIRRRLYKRSQSHETDIIRSHGEQAPALHRSSPTSNIMDWSNLAESRKNSLVENAHFIEPDSRSSSLTSTNTSTVSPAFWFNSAPKDPIKAPMSSALFGFPVTQPNAATVEAVNHLQSLTQQRYPLIPSLPSPFVPFPSTALLSSSAPSLAAFKYFMNSSSMTDSLSRMNSHPTTMEQKYQEQHKSSRLGEHSRQASNQRETTNVLSTGTDEMHHLYRQLTKSQKKIEELELDLKESRNAHAREKEARVSLEAETGKMKLLLEQMGDGLRSLAIRINPRDGDTLDECSHTSTCKDEKHQRLKHDVSRFLNRANSCSDTDMLKVNKEEETVKPRSVSHQDLQSTFFLPLPTVAVKSEEKPPPPNQNRKRSSSPLDLTVHSPGKVRRSSFEDNDGSSPRKASSPSIYYAPTSVTSSSPEVSSCDDKPTVASPSSASSETPDMALRQQAERSDFRSRSTSPFQTSPHKLSPISHGTVKVT